MWINSNTSPRSTFIRTKISWLVWLFFLFGSISGMSQNTLPDVDVKTLEGQTVNIKEQLAEGKLTIISFWATWCAPCKLELDAISEVYEDWQSSYDVSLIAVSVDDARASAKVGPMVAEKGWPFQVLTDSNQELMRKLSFQSIPYTIIVDEGGEVVYTHTGYLPGDEEELEAEIQTLQQ